jgi:hypothetical protein
MRTIDVQALGWVYEARTVLPLGVREEVFKGPSECVQESLYIYCPNLVLNTCPCSLLKPLSVSRPANKNGENIITIRVRPGAGGFRITGNTFSTIG